MVVLRVALPPYSFKKVYWQANITVTEWINKWMYGWINELIIYQEQIGMLSSVIKIELVNVSIVVSPGLYPGASAAWSLPLSDQTASKLYPSTLFFSVYLLISSSQHDCLLSVQTSLSPCQTNRRLQGLMTNTAGVKRESLKGLSHIDKEAPSRWRGLHPPFFCSL